MDKTINIAGVVGVGKSSLCNIFSDLGYKVYHEPVFDNELLEKFYYNKEKYAFPLQIFFLNKRFEMYKDSNHYPSSIMDRSIVEDRIFAKMLRDQGELDIKEYDIYVNLFNNMMEHVNSPTLMVYLRIKTANVIQRITKRGRKYELEQGEQYWYDLNHNYEIFFNEYTWSKLLTIDVDELDFVNIEKDKNYVVNLIEENLVL
jgi:deoxyadenosine/deoxycytidine kinase